LYNSKGYQLLGHTIISTSNCGNSALEYFGFGPVVEDGFGIGYIIKDDSVSFAVTSHHRQTQVRVGSCFCWLFSPLFDDLIFIFTILLLFCCICSDL
jgi:hypothetical protein